MKIERLSQISPDRVTVEFRSYMRYTPRFKTNYLTERKQSAFLYVVNGSYEFNFDGGELSIESGDIVYLPEGAAYGYKMLSEKVECMRIEFAAFLDAEAFSFSKHPIAMSKNQLKRAQDQFSKINGNSGAFEKIAAVFELFDCFADDQIILKGGENSRILPAMRYIEAHCTEHIYIADIAKLCFISQSQLRRLFDRELGMSPMEFKNHRRMEMALNMLKYTYSRVGEIAESVGFENIYVFSRVFTKYFGMSPLQYRKSLQKKQ